MAMRRLHAHNHLSLERNANWIVTHMLCERSYWILLAAINGTLLLRSREDRESKVYEVASYGYGKTTCMPVFTDHGGVNARTITEHYARA